MTHKYKRKELYKKSGVYVIKSLISEDCYIGSTSDLYERFHRHKYRINTSNKNVIKKLKSFSDEKGINNLEFVVLEFCEKGKEKATEQKYLDIYNPSLNTVKFSHSSLGFNHSESTRLRMSEARKGKKLNFTEDQRETKSKNNRGENNPKSILNERLVLLILKLRNEDKIKIKEIAKIINCSTKAIEKILYGNSWTHITKIKKNAH